MKHAVSRGMLCVAIGLSYPLGGRATAAESEPVATPGLSVRNGQLVKDGKPYRGIGANYFDLFIRLLEDPGDASYRRGLADLSAAGVPFVRFAAGGFWPKDYDLYLNHKEAYFRRLDRVVREAQRQNVGLIPSLFWYYAAVPDLVGESIDQWGNPQSKTIEFMKRYTREVVTRYKDSTAVWGWELGNEYNLSVDLPNASTHRPKIVPSLKTALTRGARDELTSPAMITACVEFARTVRRYDPDRIILSGHGVPRPSAYHNTLQRSWQRDTAAQFGEILRRDNPDPINTISVHVYATKASEYPAGAASPDELIGIVQRHAQAAGKPLFLGEFGVAADGDRQREAEAFSRYLQAIERHRVPLAAFWVYDFRRQEGQWNVTAGNQRAYMLKLIGDANAAQRGRKGAITDSGEIGGK